MYNSLIFAFICNLSVFYIKVFILTSKMSISVRFRTLVSKADTLHEMFIRWQSKHYVYGTDVADRKGRTINNV